MNKVITIFLLILIVLGFLNNIIEYFRSKTTLIRKFEHNAFRHFNHIFVPLIFVFGAIWFFLKISNELHISINLAMAGIGLLLLTLAGIPFYIYINYLINKRADYLIYDKHIGTIEIDGQPIKKYMIKQVTWHKIKHKSILIIWSNYAYVEIQMKDGRKYILTSLLLNLNILEKYFQSLPHSYDYALFPVIKNSSV